MIGLLTAILLPGILGIAWLSLLTSKLNWQTLTGYGYVLGVILTTLVIRVWDFAGLALNFWPLTFLMTLFTILPLLILRYTRNDQLHPEFTDKPLLDRWQKLLFSVLLILLIIRYLGIFLEVIWLPLYPWDAWMNWAPKAKVWFELKELVNFVTAKEWLLSEYMGYTLGNPQATPYPPAVPLIQLWIALGISEWRDDWINIPWFICTAALALGFYGQARLMKVMPHVAMSGVYILLSMPYINLHTLLAGYADIWLATAIGFATMAFFNWTVTKDRSQLLLILLFVIAAMLIKVPGILWGGIILVTVLFSLIPQRWQSLVLLSGLATMAAVALFGGINLTIPGFGPIIISLEHIQVSSYIDRELLFLNVWPAFQINYFNFGSWSLFWYVFIGGSLWLLLTGKIKRIPLPWILLVSSALICLLFIFFFIPRYHVVLLRYVTINRAVLHIIPMLVYVMILTSVRVNNDR